MPNETPAWIGKRKSKPSAPSVSARPIAWPKEKKERRESVRDWFHIAAQIASSRAEFAVLLALREWVDFRSGTCAAPNRTLGQSAGGIAAETVSRVVSRFKSAGLVIVEAGWNSRTIRLAYPNAFPVGVTLAPEDDWLDHGDQEEGVAAPRIWLDHGDQVTGTRDQPYDRARVLK